MRGTLGQETAGKSDVPESLGAVSISSYVAAKLDRDGDAAGRVVGVFRGCVIWAVENREFFCLTSRHAGNLPHGVVVDGMDRASTLGITPGTPVVMNRSEIRVGAGAARTAIARAAPWSPVLAQTCHASWHPACLERVIDVLSRAPNRRGLAHLLPDVRDLAAGAVPPMNIDLLDQRLVSGLRRLVAAVRARDGAAFLAAAALLVGTGVGLTPSGDDVLLGAIGGLMARDALAPPAEGWLAMPLQALPNHLRGRTTVVSEALLLHAVEGRFPERLLDLFGALESGDVTVAEYAAQRLSTFGMSSGREMALGALVAGIASETSDSWQRRCAA